MKSEITGKRFSRIVTTTISSVDAVTDQAEFAERIRNTDNTAWKTYENTVLRYTQIATSILDSLSLPTTPIVEFKKGEVP